MCHVSLVGLAQVAICVPHCLPSMPYCMLPFPLTTTHFPLKNSFLIGFSFLKNDLCSLGGILESLDKQNETFKSHTH